MFRATQKETIFFEMFIEASEIVAKAARKLNEFMLNYENIHEKIEELENIEHECDMYIHKIMQKLNASFITPIDREDINLIAKELDNITDAIEATAHRFRMFNVAKMRDEALLLSKLVVDCTDELRNVMLELKNLKSSDKIRKSIVEVNRIENEGDRIYRDAVTKLFVIENDPFEIIKWKEIYEFLEHTLDACEDTANIVEGVVMKHA